MAGVGMVLRAWGARYRRVAGGAANRFAARLSVLAPSPSAIVSQPEPKAIGSFARARQLEAGNFLFSGTLVQHRGAIWDIAAPDAAFLADLHGFAWIDDLAAAGDPGARRLAQVWLWAWIDRYGSGRGPGWQPDLTGRRLQRWISHAPFLLKGVDAVVSRRFFRLLGRQTRYLNWCWRHAAPGLPRFEALTGLIYAGLALEGTQAVLDAAIPALGREAARQIGADGGIASRNPEELMHIFTQLVWVARTLEDLDRKVDERHLAAIARMAPALRTLRMGDGTLARFHGGGWGAEGWLDQALADARVRAPARIDRTMGYVRLSSGRTVCVIDADRPPNRRFSERAHAGTLGIEVSAGRRPLIVNLGPGQGFGPDWARDARATAAHSTVMVERVSSSRFLGTGGIGRVLGDRLVERPQTVVAERADDLNGSWVLTSHDGYVATHGLIHERRLFLSPDGRDLRGEDTLSATSDAQRRTFSRVVAGAPKLGVSFCALFHIHPDVEAKLALAGAAVSLRLPSGETWVFRQSGGTLELTDGVCLDPGRLRPRPAKQVVVSARAVEYWGQITWALRRAEDGMRNTRDVVVELAEPGQG